MIHNPPHPGVHLKEDYLKPLGLSITETAQALGVSRKALSEVINAHVGISVDMAIRLGKAFNENPQIWLRLQQQYDVWHAGRSSAAYAKVRQLYGKEEIRP
jgi:addiction module HigA family antidote